MADALISPAVAGTMYALSTGAMAYSVHYIKKENQPDKVPLMGVTGAFVFAAQMINFTIPATGSSGHLCGGFLLAALLGPQAGFLSMIGILLIQCLLFGDGGLLALGCNIWNMAFYGCFAGALLLWKPLMKNGFSRLKITVASIAGCILTLQLGAFSVVLETTASKITALPFSVFALTMQPIHLAIGAVEGVITAVVLVFIYEARPELLYCYSESGGKKTARLSLKATMLIILISALTVGGALSLLASENPDGLEWSIKKITGSTEIAGVGGIYDKATSIIDKTALFPDYSFKAGESELGTTVSGIIGTAVIVLICVAICLTIKALKKKKKR